MALFHAATLTPTKAELLASWVPTQQWGPPADAPFELIGSFRFDDPEGRVGLETHIVRAGSIVFQVPLTYRDAPLEGADDAFVVEMHHSALGTRWVYDGLRDPQMVMMLAAVAMTGQGEAIGIVSYEGRWVVVPSLVRIHGGGWHGARVPVDGFELQHDDASGSLLVSDRFEMIVHRRPVPGDRPAVGLSATWADQAAPMVLATVRERVS